MKENISIIAAMVPGTNIIGKNNTIPWKLSSDMKYFRQKTADSTVIMGRKTYESIGRPLPKRQNIILSSDYNLNINGCIIKQSLKDAIDGSIYDNIFIIGGASLYNEGMSYANTIYLTLVFGSFDGDVSFPRIDKEWKMKSFVYHLEDENNECPYAFTTFER